MRSKRSFFEPALCKQMLKRYWPLWVMAAVVMALIGPVAHAGELGSVLKQDALDGVLMDTTMATLIAQMVFASTAALALFSPLYRTDSAVMEAALPVKRRTRYLTAVLTGLGVLEGINLIQALLMLVLRLGSGFYDQRALLEWFAVVTLQTFVYFGYAAFTALLTGKLLSATILLGLFHFAGPLMYLLWDSVLDIVLRGYYSGSAPGETLMMNLSPTVKLLSDTVYYDRYTAWPALLCYGAAALALLLLGALLYDRRPTERAEELAAFHPVKTVFHVLFMLLGTLGLGLIMDDILLYTRQRGGTPLLVLGQGLCLLASALVMQLLCARLIQKARGFKALLRGFWVPVLLVLALIALGLTGGFGWSDRVPSPEELRSATLSVAGRSGAVPPEDWEELTVIHGAVAREEKEDASESGRGYPVHFRYELQNGAVMERDFYMKAWQTPSDAAYRLQRLADRPEMVVILALEKEPVYTPGFTVSMGRYDGDQSIIGARAWQIYQEGLLPDLRSGVTLVDLSAEESEEKPAVETREAFWLNLTFQDAEGKYHDAWLYIDERYVNTRAVVDRLLPPVTGEEESVNNS